MKKVIKLVGIFFLAILAGSLIFISAPLLLPISLLLFWFFNKKKPNERLKKYAKNGIIASSVGLALWVYIGVTADPEPEVAELATLETVAEVESKELDEEKQAMREAEDEMRRELFAASQKRKE